MDSVNLPINKPRNSRTLTFRLQKVPFYYFVISAAFVFLYGMCLFYFYRIYAPEGPVGIKVFLIVLGGMAAMVLPMSTLLFLRLMRTKYVVHQDQIEIHTADHVKVVQFKDLTEVKLSFLFGGWVSLRTRDNETYFFLTAIERSEYIIDSLNRARPELMTKDHYENYRIEAIVKDHRMARMFDIILDKKRILMKYILLNITLSGLTLWLQGAFKAGFHREILGSGVFYYMIYLFFSLFISFTLLNFCEYYLTEKGRKLLIEDSERRVRNLVLEKRVWKIFNVAHVAMMIAFFLFVRTLGS